MGVLEIISGIVLLLCSLFIIAVVMMQDSKGNGLSGTIGGGEMLMGGAQSKGRTAMLAKWTKYAAFAFFVIAILVGVISVYVK